MAFFRQGHFDKNTNVSGTYVLVLYLTGRTRLKIGRLGVFCLKPGCYYYVGSAFGPGGLPARLHHHLQPARLPHWHVDYLRQTMRVEQIWYGLHQTHRECEWASLLLSMPSLSAAISRFGSSDCRCQTHLSFSKMRPDRASFADIVASAFPDDLPLQFINC